jgi:8-oxo-dGTP pyrophosphatase MutT (NUDIX family)
MVALGTEADGAAWRAELAAVQSELSATFDGLSSPGDARLRPILAEQCVIGIWCFDTERDGVWFVVRPDQRGRGFGDDVVELLVEQGYDLLLPPHSEARGYFQERGYLALGVEDSVLRLRPPTRVDERREAASVCLFEPTTQHVLVGERLTPPWSGYWAFPGGKLEPGERALQGALRELEEETGIRVSDPEVLRETRVYAGGAGTIYGIDNFCIRAPLMHPPAQLLPELRARWVSLEEARVLRPMAAGTRRVIRRVRQLADG